MAKNYVAPGNTMDVVLIAKTKSGDPIIVGKKVVIAAIDGEIGDDITTNTCGVWQLPKAAGAIEQGANVYLTGDGEITTTDTDNTLAGYAYAGAASGDDSIMVNIG